MNTTRATATKRDVTIQWGWEKGTSSTTPVTASLRIEDAATGAPLADVSLSAEQVTAMLSSTVIRAVATTTVAAADVVPLETTTPWALVVTCPSCGAAPRPCRCGERCCACYHDDDGDD